MRRQRELPQFILDHIREYEEDPAKAHLFDCRFAGGFPDTPTLMLSTTGRKSGQPTAPMPLIYGQDGDRYVIVGSNGGLPTHTGWYRNLQVNPDVEVQVAADRFRARAYKATGDERNRLWGMMAKVYPLITTTRRRPSVRSPSSSWNGKPT